jgi:hypothetical protein
VQNRYFEETENPGQARVLCHSISGKQPSAVSQIYDEKKIAQCLPKMDLVVPSS